jgi:hypothetical protein
VSPLSLEAGVGFFCAFFPIDVDKEDIVVDPPCSSASFRATLSTTCLKGGVTGARMDGEAGCCPLLGFFLLGDVTVVVETDILAVDRRIVARFSLNFLLELESSTPAPIGCSKEDVWMLSLLL